jgi:hypothetical protein
MNSLTTSLPLLLPVAAAWGIKQELIIREKGLPLDENQLADALRVGVKQPEKIRIALVEALPQPEHEDVLSMARRIGLFSSSSVAITLGHGICLRHGVWEDRQVFVHECVHVAQYERLGGIYPFFNVYLHECIEPGYPFGALEQEAIHTAQAICRTNPGPAS